MPGISLRVIVIGLAMLVASGLAVAMKPTQRMADMGPKVDLETMIPKEFGDWRVDTSIMPLIPSPDAQALINRIYDQTLSRTYVNSRGERVMLSIAYGGDQSDAMQVHKPEVCYPAQGFSIVKNLSGLMRVGIGEIPIRQLVAVQRHRREPITYWITVGDQVTRSGIEQKMAQMKYGLSGVVPDGLLFRVSNIASDDDRAFGLQRVFVEDLLKAVDPSTRLRLAGSS